VNLNLEGDSLQYHKGTLYLYLVSLICDFNTTTTYSCVNLILSLKNAYLLFTLSKLIVIFLVASLTSSQSCSISTNYYCYCVWSII